MLKFITLMIFLIVMVPMIALVLFANKSSQETCSKMCRPRPGHVKINAHSSDECYCENPDGELKLKDFLH